MEGVVKAPLEGATKSKPISHVVGGIGKSDLDLSARTRWAVISSWPLLYC